MQDKLVHTFHASRDDGSIIIVNEWQGFHRVLPEKVSPWIPDLNTNFRTDAGIAVAPHGQVEGSFWIPSTSEKLTRVVGS